jgi:DNA-binding transcriptional LysR family regulator
VRELLGRLENETLSVMAHQGAGGLLELAVIPTFATRWLIPRLTHFNARHGDITLNLTTRAEPFMFTDTPFDAAIHFGEPVWAGAVAEFLFGEEMVPVCAPAMLGGAKALTAQELGKKPLLHHSARPDAWREWFEEAGLPNVSAIRGPRYELFSMLVEAARAGLGVALVPRFFVLTEVNSGELAIPNPCFTRSKRAYYLVYPEGKAQSPSLEVFRNWLKEQAAAYIREREGYHSPPL